MALSPTLQQSILMKVLFIGSLIITLLIPLLMIKGIVNERRANYEQVVYEVGNLWGYAQNIAGPVISVPYLRTVKDENGKEYRNLYKAYFLPDKLNIQAKITPEIRYRSIYEVVVYRADLTINGQFPAIALNQWNVQDSDILWDDVNIVMGIQDTRGIHDTLFMQWDQQSLEFNSGTNDNLNLLDQGGLHIPLPKAAETLKIPHNFNFTVSLNGNASMQFAPLGKQTQVKIESNWKDVSFVGAFLPLERQISESGFNAQWSVSHLGRNFPQYWTTEKNVIQLNSHLFGISLLIPVDFYTKTERSVKYGILFIVLTFTFFFLFEVLSALRLHPLQYLMVGTALCLFYLLLLSFSEHTGFITAYLVASMSTIVMISVYTSAILKSQRRAFLMASALAVLYGYLYVLLHLQDYALLFGSIGLFFILAGIMYITRHIDWYSVSLPALNTVNPPIEPPASSSL